MTEFRVPHPFQNIGDAIKDAFDPNTPDSTDRVVQLMDENNRAIEDAIDRGSVTGSAFIAEFDDSDDQVDQLYDWTLPTISGLYLCVFTLVGVNMSSGYTVELGMNGRRWSVDAIDSTLTSAVTGFALAQNSETLAFACMWRGVDSTRDLRLSGGAIKIQ
jgi:hypothetical protein